MTDKEKFPTRSSALDIFGAFVEGARFNADYKVFTNEEIDNLYKAAKKYVEEINHDDN